MRYQAFLETSSGWLSLSDACPSVEVAVRWVRHYLDWLELAAKTYDLSDPARASWRAAVERDECTVAIVTTEAQAWPAYMKTLPDGARHSVISFQKLEEDGEPFWLEEPQRS